jgi:hypothetical protein
LQIWKSHIRKGSVGRVQKKGGRKLAVTKSKIIKLPTIKPRTVPLKLVETVKLMSKAQKESVRKMGFGKMLSMKVDGVPAKLGYFLVEKLNTEKMVIDLGEIKISVDEDSIHKLLGVPRTGVKLSSLERTRAFEGIQKEWRDMYPGTYINPSEIVKRIKGNPEDDGRMFRLDFVTLFVSTMVERQTSGNCKIDFVHHLNENTWVEEINWCSFIVDCIKTCKTGWVSGGGMKTYFGGAVTVLMVRKISMHTKFI